MERDMSDSESDKAFEAVSETMRSLQEQEEIEMEQHYQQALWQANQAAQASWLYGALLDCGFEFEEEFEEEE
jgi:hypothetical protein